MLALFASGPSPVRIVRYVTISRRRRFLALPSLSSPLSTPRMRGTSLGFWISLDSRHRGARVPRTDIKRHANRAVLHDFSAAAIFGVVVSLIAAAGVISTGLITKRPEKSPRLTARGTQGTRPMGHGRRPRDAWLSNEPPPSFIGRRLVQSRTPRSQYSFRRCSARPAPS